MVPRLVSIGTCCAVRHHIDDFYGAKQQTQLFDWVLSSLDTVKYMLTAPLHTCAVQNWNEFGVWNNGHGKLTKRLCLMNAPYFENIHDMLISDTDYTNMAEKFMRRHRRFLDLVKSHEPLLLVHFTEKGPPPPNEEFEDLLAILSGLRKAETRILALSHSHSYPRRALEPAYRYGIMSINLKGWPHQKHTFEWRYDGYQWKRALRLAVTCWGAAEEAQEGPIDIDTVNL